MVVVVMVVAAAVVAVAARHLHLHPERSGAGEVADVQREEVVERPDDRGQEIVPPERQPRAAGAARHRRLSRDEREEDAALPLPRVRPREQHRVRGAVKEEADALGRVAYL